MKYKTCQKETFQSLGTNDRDELHSYKRHHKAHIPSKIHCTGFIRTLKTPPFEEDGLHSEQNDS